MRMAMATATAAMQSVRRGAEATAAAGWRAAIGLAVRARHRAQSGTAIGAWSKPHRDRADGRCPHHRQDNATRAFHGVASVCRGVIGRIHSGMCEVIRQEKVGCFKASCGVIVVCQLPIEKCPAKAGANEPKPPRVTPPEPDSEEVPDEAWLDEEESRLKKLVRDQPLPEPPWPPDDVEPRWVQLVLDCAVAGAAIPGEEGWAF